MQLVSAAARKTFSDAPAARPPNETMTGQRLSFGGRSTLPSPAPTNRTVASQPKVGRRAAAGTTTAPEVRLCQRAEATRYPRARPTDDQVRHFDPARRNPYAQGTGPLAPDNAASAPAGYAASPRVMPSAIRDEPTVENRPTDLSRAGAIAAQGGHFDPPATTRTPREPAHWHRTTRRRLAERPAHAQRRPHSATSQLPGTEPPAFPTHVQPAPRSAISILPAATRTPRGRARWHPPRPRRSTSLPVRA
jgi:hypothetical protein